MAQEQKSTRCKEQKAPKNTSCPRAARPFSMHVCIPQKELDNLVVSSRVYVSKVLLLLLLVVMVLFLLLLLGKKRIPWCLGQPLLVTVKCSEIIPLMSVCLKIMWLSPNPLLIHHVPD
jgi:hypothetical protein